MKIIINIFTFILISFSSFSIIAFAFGAFKKRYAHYPYSSKMKDGVSYNYNEYGARGDSYKGEDLRIGIVGSSVSYGLGLEQKEFWGEQLKKHLKRESHIESFGLNTIGDYDLIELMEFLAQEVKIYDLLIIHYSFYIDEKANYHRNNSVVKIKNIDYLEKRLFDWWKYIVDNSVFLSLLLNENQDLVQTGLFFNHKFRQENSKLMINVSVNTISLNKREKVKNRIKQVSALAKKVSKNHIFIPEGFAYHKDMLPSYYKNVSINKPAPTTLGRFYNLKSLAKYYKQRNKLNSTLFKELELDHLDWIDHFLSKMSEEEGLFLDEVHLSEKGSEIFAKIISKTDSIRTLEASDNNSKH